jgi:galactose oxidase
MSARTVTNTHHDMFCPGISTLEDGRVLIQGGSDAKKSTFYNPSTNTFTAAPDLITARGYQSSSTLSDGRIFTIGGAYSGVKKGKDGEVYDPKTNSWKALPGAKMAPMLTTDHEGNHAWLFSWKKGSIFQAGPSKAMNWYTANGAGTQVAAGTRDTDDAMCGIFVMYEPGKILTAGGSSDYTDSDANKRAHIITIDEVNKPAKVERAPDMAYPRGFSNAVVLPDGTVLVTGGQRRSKVFTDDDGILWAELFNPATKSWKTLAPQAVPRNYHSVSILLPDGRVFSGGGGLCYAGTYGRSTVECNKLVDHADGQTFSPPYLFNKDGSEATRPVISALSSTTVRVGGTLRISTNTVNPKFVLVRLGSVTHSVNTDQRRVPLTNVTSSGSSNEGYSFSGGYGARAVSAARPAEYTATLPNDSGILIPGHYYLFVLNANGTPSMAKTVKVSL